jgi:bcr-type benzoyl-CoA reductase subunit C
MDVLQRFHEIARTPLREWEGFFPDRRPVGVYNAYVPEEMFHAAGLTPIYLFHQHENRGNARTHLPSFVCWPGRSLVDQAVAGDLNGLAGIAFAQTCDTVQALTDICRKVMTGVPVYHVGVPANLASPAAQSYLVAELNRLREALGNPTEDALHQAYAVYDRTRQLMAWLYDRAWQLQPTDLYATLRAGLLSPKDTYNPWLASLLDTLPDNSPQRPRLILVGSHLSDPTVYQVIESAGACVVDDFLDVGHRYFARSGAMNGDPVVALATRILATLPTPTKLHPDRRRDKHLVDLVTQKAADGVIFTRQAFCDPHGFDYASMRADLKERDIPHLLMELEQTPQVGQMRTRVEAFLETLGQ